MITYSIYKCLITFLVNKELHMYIQTSKPKVDYTIHRNAAIVSLLKYGTAHF